MGKLSIYARNSLLDHIHNNVDYVAPATVYLAIATATISETDTGATILEADYGSYNRVALTFSEAVLATRSITQSADSVFPKSTSGNIIVTDYAIMDSGVVGAGNVLGFGKFTVPKNIVADNTPSVRASEVVITASTTGGFSNYLVKMLLDFMFRNQTYTKPDLYVGISTATVSNTDDGTTVSEVIGNDYARVIAPSFSDAVNGELYNDGDIVFPVAGIDGWGLITTLFCSDTISLNVGNILFYDNDNVIGQIVGDGDNIVIPASYFTSKII